MKELQILKENMIKIPPRMLEEVEREIMIILTAAVSPRLARIMLEARLKEDDFLKQLLAELFIGFLGFQRNYLKITPITSAARAQELARETHEISYKRLYNQCAKFFPKEKLFALRRRALQSKVLQIYVKPDFQAEGSAAYIYIPEDVAQQTGFGSEEVDAILIAADSYEKLGEDLARLISISVDKKRILPSDAWEKYFSGAWMNLLRTDVYHELSHWVQMWIFDILSIETKMKEIKRVEKALQKYSQGLAEIGGAALVSFLQGKDSKGNVAEIIGNIEKEQAIIDHGFEMSKYYEQSPYTSSIVFTAMADISQLMMMNPAIKESDIKAYLLKFALSNPSLGAIKKINPVIWKKMLKGVYVNVMRMFSELTRPKKKKTK